MAGVNKVILLGNLGADPDIKAFESGNKMARVSLATNEFFKNKHGEMVEKTEWHNVILWGRRAELAEQYLRRGSPLYVEGRLRTRKWDDKDGNTRYTTEVFADVLNFIGGKSPSATGTISSGTEDTPEPRGAEVPPEEDDLPF